jgi:hypothetical protein
MTRTRTLTRRQSRLAPKPQPPAAAAAAAPGAAVSGRRLVVVVWGGITIVLTGQCRVSCSNSVSIAA